MDSLQYNSDRLTRPSMSGQSGGQSAYYSTASNRPTQTSLPSLRLALQNPAADSSSFSSSSGRGQSSRRRVRTSTSDSAVNDNSSSSLFRPLELSLPRDTDDWNFTVGNLSPPPSSQSAAAASSSRQASLSRTGSSIRNRQSGRRLFGTLSPTSERPRRATQQGTSRHPPLSIRGAAAYRNSASQTNEPPQSRTSSSIAALDYAFDVDSTTTTSSPRLELPEQSLHSFKRSFEDAAFSSVTGRSGADDSLSTASSTRSQPSDHIDDLSPSASILTFSPTSPTSASTSPVSPNNAEEPSVRQFRSILGRFESSLLQDSSSSAGSTSAVPSSSASVQSAPSAVSMPESWLRLVDTQSDNEEQGGEDRLASTSSGIRHTPPTPENAGWRVKRRRSRTNGSDTVLRPEDDESEVTESLREETRSNSPVYLSDAGHNGSVIDDNDTLEEYEPDQDMFSDPFELPSDMEDTDMHDNVSSSAQIDEISVYGSPLESPPAPTPVSVRRGLQRQFSLGSLPLFHFEEEGDEEESTPGPQSALEELDSIIGAYGASGGDTDAGSRANSIRFRSRLPRRPNLQRNTTAVSPPEESPLNTPEEGEHIRLDGTFSRPGLAPWRIPSAATSHPQQANEPQSLAAGVFIPGRSLSSQGFLQSRYNIERDVGADVSPTAYNTSDFRQLSLDLDVRADVLENRTENRFIRDTPVHTSSTGHQLNILGSAENGRSRTESETTNVTHPTISSSTSSSSGAAGWHSDAERMRAELLSDHLDTSRQIAADVQSRQGRLTEPATPAQQAATPAASAPLLRASASTSSEGARTSTVPPRVSFSSALGSVSREASLFSLQQHHSHSGSNHRSSRNFGDISNHQAVLQEASSPRRSRMPPSASNSFDYSSSSMSAADIRTSRPSHRYGSLGSTNMRGPTRSSNEAWMRSQGIDFYDSFSRLNPLQPSQSPSTVPFHPLPITSRHSHSHTQESQQAGWRSHPRSNRANEPLARSISTPMSARPSTPAFAAGQVAHESRSSESPVHADSSIWNNDFGNRSGNESGITTPFFGLRPAAATSVSSHLHRNGRTVSAGHAGVSLDRSAVSGRFTPLSLASRRTASPQLDAIRPVSPLLQPATITGQAQHLALDNAPDNDPASTASATSLSIPLTGPTVSSGQLQDDQQSTPLRQPHSPFRATTRSNPRNHAIADWFRGYTNELPPTATPSVEAATSEVEEASDGIAAAVRRLDDVRRILDEVQESIQRRRASYEARNTTTATPLRQREQQSGTSHHLLRGISSSDSRNSQVSTLNQAQEPLSARLSRHLPSIRAPPVASVSRSVHFADAATGASPDPVTHRNTTDGILESETSEDLQQPPTNPIRQTWRQPPPPRTTTSRPTLRPFEEIFARVEAEFAQRDRTNAPGERSSGTRDFLQGLSRQRREEIEAPLSPEAPRASSTASLALQIDRYRAEVERLRQHMQRDWSPHRSGFALQDSSNTGLPDIAGLRARLSGDLPSFDSDLFGDSTTRSTASRPSASESSRTPLPPFLLRTLRTRGQPLFGQREGAVGIGTDPRDWMGDSDIDLSYESLMAISERLGDVRRRGATEEALARGLTIYKYTTTSTASADGETRCAICLEDYEESDEIARSNKCNHALHNNCFSTWLRRVTTCPICRQEAV
ncbi:hypothetical protein P389DRAFT_90801 [Cystobasidium minutum MCA 4210]|uniref:uncharacterized protein n=1 Tax=Cystobasidium minutum MCA 4210 TaxID=1397322 RepID=UPI0034CD331B|eukprot:jgi/Rhomi1/90801/CE90800_1132